MNYRNKALKTATFVLILTLMCGIMAVCAYADTQDAENEIIAREPAQLENGYYHISNEQLSAMLGYDVELLSESGLMFGTEKGADTAFELIRGESGTYRFRAGTSQKRLFVAYDTVSGEPVLAYENSSDGLCLDFEIYESENGYHVLPAATEEGYFGVEVSEDGTLIALVADEDCIYPEWKIEKIKIESLKLSLNSINTRPYVTYTDLRAVVSPSYLSDCIGWESEDRGVLIVDNDGRFCTLSEGKVTIIASVGGKSAECVVDVSYDNQYAWFSQNNVSTGGWNGDALYNIYFKSGGVKKRFATNDSTKKTDWLSEGCALCSIAQVLNNMGARYAKGYDFRSGIQGNLFADPYTVALANTNNVGAASAKQVLPGDPIFTSQNAIASRFNVDGAQVTVDTYYNVTKKKIKEALDRSPWGVVVCFENSSWGKHYITFNKCLNPEEKNPNKYIFTVSDPASLDAYNAADVVFEQSYSYKRLYYRFSQATLMQVWSYEGYQSK